MVARVYNDLADAMGVGAAEEIQAGTTNNVFIRIYEGPRPGVNVGPAGTTPTGVLIVEYDMGTTPLGNPPVGSAGGSGDTHAFSGIPTSDDALAAYNFSINGGYGVVVDRDGNIAYNGSLGGPGSGSDFEVTPLSGALGLTITLNAASFTIPQA